MYKLFPQPISSRHGGAPVAKWVFLLVTVITVGRSLAHIFLPDGGAQSIATIPLDSLTTILIPLAPVMLALSLKETKHV